MTIPTPVLTHYFGLATLCRRLPCPEADVRAYLATRPEPADLYIPDAEWRLRDTTYHLVRIHWFVVAGIGEPIILGPHGRDMALIDGHHRVIAAILRGDGVVPMRWDQHAVVDPGWDMRRGDEGTDALTLHRATPPLVAAAGASVTVA